MSKYVRHHRAVDDNTMNLTGVLSVLEEIDASGGINPLVVQVKPGAFVVFWQQLPSIVAPATGTKKAISR